MSRNTSDLSDAVSVLARLSEGGTSRTFVAADEPPLRGRFHSHITVRATDQDSVENLRTFCRACRVKLTVVDLADFHGRSQRDVMITRYFLSDRDDAVPRIVDDLTNLGRRLERIGFPVLRIKLEHESLPTLSRFTARQYREVHLKLHIPSEDFDSMMERLKHEMTPLGAVPSRNPYDRREGTVVQFLNLRFYEGDLPSTESRICAVADRLEAIGAEVVETKRETTVFDTNQRHDQWWA